MQTFFEKLLTGLLDALPHILWALVAFFVGLAIANWLSRFVLRALKRSKVDPTVHAFLAACVKIFVLIIAILTAFLPPASSPSSAAPLWALGWHSRTIYPISHLA